VKVQSYSFKYYIVIFPQGVTNYNILTRITQLGIIISLICLSMCIFTFWFFSEIQSTRTTIHKNLCCSLFLAELIFLIGINMNNNKVGSFHLCLDLCCKYTVQDMNFHLLLVFPSISMNIVMTLTSQSSNRKYKMVI